MLSLLPIFSFYLFLYQGKEVIIHNSFIEIAFLKKRVDKFQIKESDLCTLVDLKNWNEKRIFEIDEINIFHVL